VAVLSGNAQRRLSAEAPKKAAGLIKTLIEKVAVWHLT
jgi:hypothetical protein